jgi:hypothetical protein
MSSTDSYMEKFNLKRLNDVEFKEEYQVKISNRFATLEKKLHGNNDGEINRAWD